MQPLVTCVQTERAASLFGRLSGGTSIAVGVRKIRLGCRSSGSGSSSHGRCRVEPGLGTPKPQGLQRRPSRRVRSAAHVNELDGLLAPHRSDSVSSNIGSAQYGKGDQIVAIQSDVRCCGRISILCRSGCSPQIRGLVPPDRPPKKGVKAEISVDRGGAKEETVAVV